MRHYASKPVLILLTAAERFLAHDMLAVSEGCARTHPVYERLDFARVPAIDWSPVPGVTLIA